MPVSTTRSRLASLVAAGCLVLAPIQGCGSDDDSASEEEPTSSPSWTQASWSATRNATTGAWEYVADTTTGLRLDGILRCPRHAARKKLSLHQLLT